MVDFLLNKPVQSCPIHQACPRSLTLLCENLNLKEFILIFYIVPLKYSFSAE